MRVRLAPSPTGTLHIGTARTALYNWLFAKKNKGQFLLRIEDTDNERSKHEYLQNILDGLSWLGLNWDESPIIQSQNIEAHQSTIKSLLNSGLAYRCYATDEELDEMRKSQKINGLAPRYDNRHRDLSDKQEELFIKEGRLPVIRFKIEENKSIVWNDLIRGEITWNTSDLGGDMVIARRSEANEIGSPLYNLVVVVDDSNMHITHVIRGEDHIANTAKQILIYKALGKTIPKFAHTPLILNSEGKKLSKRDGVTSINEFKSMGYTPEAMTNYMALLGWSLPEELSEIFTIKEAAKFFSLSKVNKAGAKFDWDKLKWINSQIIHDLATESLLQNLENLWAKEGWESRERSWKLKLTALIGPSLTVLTDCIEQSRPFFEIPVLMDDGEKQLKEPKAKEALQSLLKELDERPWDGENLDQAKEILSIAAKSVEVKKGILMKSLRAALLGTLNGPDLLLSWSLLACIGQDRSRIRSCI